MNKINIEKRIRNSLFFGKGLDKCPVHVFKFYNNLKDIKHYSYNITRKSDEEYILEEADHSYINKKSTVDGFKFEVIKYQENKDQNYTGNVKCEYIYYIDDKEGNSPYVKSLTFNYDSDFKEINGNKSDIIEFNGSKTIDLDIDNNKIHLIFIAFPFVKCIPLISVCELDIIESENTIEDESRIKDLLLDDILLNKDIIFSSYHNKFSTKSYETIFKGEHISIKNTPEEDKAKELNYLLCDEYEEKSNTDIHYKNTCTGIESVLEKINNKLQYSHLLNGIIFSRSIYSDDGTYTEVLRGGITDTSKGTYTEFYDYGYQKDENIAPHMKRMDENNMLTDNEVKLLEISEFIDLNMIDYEDEYPIAKHYGDNIKNGSITLYDSNDMKEYFNKFFPYQWTDSINNREIELVGLVPTDEGDEAGVSTLIIDERIMIESIAFSQGQQKYVVTKIYKLGQHKPVYWFTQSTEISLYASNIITEVDLKNGIKFRITNRKNTDVSGKITGDFYSYESPELNIIIDRLNNKITEFTSSIYNKYFNDIIYVRNMYGCLEKLDISNLKK